MTIQFHKAFESNIKDLYKVRGHCSDNRYTASSQYAKKAIKISAQELQISAEVRKYRKLPLEALDSGVFMP